MTGMLFSKSMVRNSSKVERNGLYAKLEFADVVNPKSLFWINLAVWLGLAEHFWHICTCRVAFKEVARIVFCAGPASAAYLTVLAYSASAFDVAFVSQPQV